MKKYKVLFADLDGTLIETVSGSTFPIIMPCWCIKNATCNTHKYAIC